VLPQPLGERTTRVGTHYAGRVRQTPPRSQSLRRFFTTCAVDGLAFFLHQARPVTENKSRTERERSVLIPEAAGVLGVSRRTVYYRIREGRLQTIRTRGGSQRVLWSSIEALLRSMHPGPLGPEANGPQPER
jgi:excisionase family DNA binding protein